ncbi:hypothetical protein Afe04nite_08290 [Asanoa ferruginea]|nr:hypothetical protein Afe04nite_08290 [Asanoa ferruginea]
MTLGGNAQEVLIPDDGRIKVAHIDPHVGQAGTVHRGTVAHGPTLPTTVMGALPTAREGAIMAEKSKQKGDAKKPAERSLKEKRAAKKLKAGDRADHNSKIPPSGR